MLLPERLKTHLSQNHIPYSPILYARLHSAQMATSFMHVLG
jgi:hypothetical protein